jgi:hypothetical protein
MAHDVAGFHAGHEMIVEVQVRAADGATRNLDDGVPLVLNPGIGYAIAADVRGAVPNECLHRDLRCLNVSVFRPFNISQTRSFQEIWCETPSRAASKRPCDRRPCWGPGIRGSGPVRRPLPVPARLQG